MKLISKTAALLLIVAGLTACGGSVGGVNAGFGSDGVSLGGGLNGVGGVDVNAGLGGIGFTIGG